MPGKPKYTPDERAKIAERVRRVVATRDEPPGMLDLFHLCAGFASEHDVRLAVEHLTRSGLVTSRNVRNPRTAQLKTVYSPVPSLKQTRSNRR